MQTHESPVEKNSLTQAGFYGHTEKLRPLTQTEIPTWAKVREKVTDDTGTSIYVPFTEYRDDLYPETRITVVANFFLQSAGALEVIVDEEKIDKNNVKEKFKECRAI